MGSRDGKARAVDPVQQFAFFSLPAVVTAKVDRPATEPRLDSHCGAIGFDGPRPPLTPQIGTEVRSEEHTSELQSLMRISYAVFCLTKKHQSHQHLHITELLSSH